MIPSRPQGFQTLVLLILEQQVSIDSAKATFKKLKMAFPNVDPRDFCHLSEEELRVFGVSRQKAKYISSLATAILNIEIDLGSLSSKSAETVRKELIKFKGIGNWTIDIYLMFCLQSPDIIPLGDIAVVNTIKELLNIHDKEAMRQHAANCAPCRSIATYLLWHYYLNKRNRKIDYSL
jgi:DNA-3-methyladenine glycosylase II